MGELLESIPSSHPVEHHPATSGKIIAKVYKNDPNTSVVDTSKPLII